VVIGVTQRDDGHSINVVGQRDDANTYIVDGVKMRGNLGLPQSSIAQLEVITGGLPARYGDATGAVINITTKGPSKQFGGGLELTSSEFLDPQGYNLASLSLTGPIVTGKPNGKHKDFSLGYFLTAEYEGNKDANPSAVGMWQVKDDVYNRLSANPLRPSTLATGFVPSAEFLTLDSLQKNSSKRDVQDHSYRFNAKVDFNPGKNIFVSIGGNVSLEDYASYSFGDQLMTPGSQLRLKDNTYRVYGRFSQYFGGNKDSKDPKEKPSSFSNAYYTVQIDYTKFYRTFEDQKLKDNFFDYGYIGKFNTQRAPVYSFGQDTAANGQVLSGMVLQGYSDTLVKFTPDENTNPLLTRYTQQYYELANGDYSLFYPSLSAIQFYGGLINGQGPPSIYSLWSNVGTPTGNYGHADNDQFRLTVFGNVDYVPKSKLGLKDQKKVDRSRHSIQFGVEYEQRTDRSYSLAPRALWSLARQYANNHLHDGIANGFNNSIEYTDPVYDQFGVFQDTINYVASAGSDQSYFDQSLRNYLMNNPTIAMDQLGHLVTPTSYINVDALDPSVFKLSYFSPDELFQDGNSAVFYYGYDYLGNVLKKQPSFDDFFTQKMSNDTSVYQRNIAAYRPVYAAAYIQDKFSFKDLFFNIGLRVDRFDANQKVLKDRYLLYPAYTAGELGGTALAGKAIPSTIGSDYVVYGNDPTQPSQILGFRNGDTWYDAEGNQVSDPKVILPLSGKISPYLKATDVTKLQVTSDAFTDYTPQFTIMPRVAFSFPISEDALFFAHYDVLSQRPVGSNGSSETGSPNISSPFVYYYLRNIAVNSVIENAALKPEKTIDYQVGFRQGLGKSSTLTISGIYRELKDQVQVEPVNFAYPINYRSFGNQDFGTVKSLQVGYQMDRTHNVQLQINYTLQFADGTGSNATSALGLINSSQPNQKIILPFDYDQRHTISTIFDYRFGEGDYNAKKDIGYNGPRVGKKAKPILQNTGLNLIFRAGSGTPYSRAKTPTTIQSGVVQNTSYIGSRNGSRLPWSFKIDLKLDKDWKITQKSKMVDGKTVPGGSFYFNTYILIQNVLNAKNVLGVYSYTGNPNDDGYLSSGNGSQYASSQLDPQSFIDLYSLKVNNPDNYSLPRRIKVGASFSF